MATTATLLAQLKQRRDAVIAELSAIDSTKAGGKPNVSGAGVNVDHVGYKRALYEELDALEKQINRLDVGVVEHEGR